MPQRMQTAFSKCRSCPQFWQVKICIMRPSTAASGAQAGNALAAVARRMKEIVDEAHLLDARSGSGRTG